MVDLTHKGFFSLDSHLFNHTSIHIYIVILWFGAHEQLKCCVNNSNFPKDAMFMVSPPLEVQTFFHKLVNWDDFFLVILGKFRLVLGGQGEF
jgi:hypothetical protein